MNHTYRLFEVLDGHERDTGKSFVIMDPNDRYDVIGNIFKVYGFTLYIDSYSVRLVENDTIYVNYNYIDGGMKDTWVLRRGI